MVETNLQVNQPHVLALPCCGIGNRFRVIASAVQQTTHEHERVLVLWHSDLEVGAGYHELFEPHPRFEVVDLPADSERDFGAESPSCSAHLQCVKWHHAGAESDAPSCSSASQTYNATLAAAALPLPAAAELPRQTIVRGCGGRFAAENDAVRCSDLLRGVRVKRALRSMVEAALPRSREALVGVHLRPRDDEMDTSGSETGGGVGGGGGRRLSMGMTQCHPVELFASRVGEEARSNRRLTTVYVATSSRAYAAEFARALWAETSNASRRLRILTLADVLEGASGQSGGAGGADGAGGAGSGGGGGVGGSGGGGSNSNHSGVPRSGGTSRRLSAAQAMAQAEFVGRASVSGMQAAAIDLWALASSAKLFRSGQSTFGQLAAAMHLRPEEVVVRDTSLAECPAWLTLYANASAGLPAFCTPFRGKTHPKSCACRP